MKSFQLSRPRLRVPFLDIRAQYAEVKASLEPLVTEILASGAYVLGNQNKALEAEIAKIHGVRHGIAVNSGTDALRIMMQAAGIGSGDEVITTAFTFVASVEAIVQLGAVPVFVDIDPKTFNIDPRLVESAITSKTRAIMPIHLFGQLANMREVGEIASAKGLMVFEDAAQALCSSYEGSFAGNFGVAAGISFYVTKNLGAAGDGGMILTNEDGIAEACRSLRVHGMGKERYYYDSVGYTSRMDEIQAAVLIEKLKRLDTWNQRRNQIAEIYLSNLEGVQLPVTAQGNNNTWHQFAIRSTNRDALQQFLKNQEVDSMIYYPVPLHFHAPYLHLGEGQGSLPETELACLEVLCLPIHPHLSDEQVQFVVQAVREFSRTAVNV